MKSALIISGILMLICNGLSGQIPGHKTTREEYIRQYAEIAIEEMNNNGIPASIKLAQGLLESGSGNSELALKANNHFGIKCHKEWNGDTFYMDDDEKNECFRKYKEPRESYKDHSLFLTTRDRYNTLFDLEITDYKGWAKGLKSAGYATNPNYTQLLIKMIEENELYKYDAKYKKPKDVKHAAKAPEEIINESSVIPTADFKYVKTTASGREVYENNGVKVIIARRGDTFYSIANDFEIYTHQVYKYNDLRKKDSISEGQIIYLEPKKSSSKKLQHTVKPGEGLYDISQRYGIKLKNLCKYNSLRKDATLYPDQKIRLKK
jgi:LysM repeat protein